MGKHLSAPIAMTMGDPAGCGPQITKSAWQALKSDPACAFAVIAPPSAFVAHGPIEIISDMAEARDAFSKALPILPIDTDLPEISPGAPNQAAASAIIASVETATTLALSGAAGALVTNPINKALLYSAGFAYPGHTEFLAALCAPKGDAPTRPVMMLVGGGLRVALATIHMPLMETSQALSEDLLIEVASITHKALQSDFGITAPKLAFTGLNPHAGENGTIGHEEIEIINPAAKKLRKQGITISDARSADTVFAESLTGAYDAVIAMTHDQGLIPVKTLDFWGGVNTTLGLPIIRTSPDHGTAYEAAAKAHCRPDSLIAAIKLASQNAMNRKHA